MSDLLPSVWQLRAGYGAVRAALPWLDASAYPGEPPAFGAFAKPADLPVAAAMAATHELAGRVARLRREGALQLARYSPAASGPLEEMGALLAELAETRVPFVVLHTDVPFPRIRALADAHPRLNVVIESGPRKILYFFREVQELLAPRPNLFLSTYNLCNWLGLERLAESRLGQRLLFGTHAPAFSPDAAMGPIVMGRLPWETKCDIAGNTLRRLLGIPEERPPEVPWAPPAPFIIDAHGHCLTPGTKRTYNFPTPDEEASFTPKDWTDFLDSIAVEMLFVAPGESLLDTRRPAREGCRHLLEAAPARFRYFVVFDPRLGDEHTQTTEEALKDPLCVGVKIHPSMHGTPADDDSYGPMYELALRADKPVLTHSWEVSSYNATQHLSHPDRFRKHLEQHPGVRLVLAHAGGRPSTFEAVAAICRDFAGVQVDLAGDYFDSGLLDALAERIGPRRILFASDVDWIDPRCNLGPALASGLSDEDLLLILRDNAMRTYGVARASCP